jgi:two-component system, cell cycle sensor histidine kinase and response regulator CckA
MAVRWSEKGTTLMSGEERSSAGQTLLIVDDEEMLVELVRRMVIRQGYSALIATSGEEALSLYEQDKDKINLVITDLIMPGMDGKALAEELMRRDPNVRILVSTGFSADSDISSLVEAGVKGVVMKPYQSEQLFEKIREAMAA